MHARTITLLGAAVCAALLAGCAERSGVATEASPPQVWAAGPEVPDIQYTARDGQTRDFNKVRYPVTLVAFSAPQGSNCCWLDPRVAKIWDDLRNLPVTMAQFSLPTSRCPHGPGCVEGCNLHKGRLMTICDSHRVAWKAFGRPDPGSLILIERGGRIVKIGTLDHPKSIVAEALKLGRQEAKQYGPGEAFELYDDCGAHWISRMSHKPTQSLKCVGIAWRNGSHDSRHSGSRSFALLCLAQALDPGRIDGTVTSPGVTLRPYLTFARAACMFSAVAMASSRVSAPKLSTALVPAGYSARCSQSGSPGFHA